MLVHFKAIVAPFNVHSKNAKKANVNVMFADEAHIHEVRDLLMLALKRYGKADFSQGKVSVKDYVVPTVTVFKKTLAFQAKPQDLVFSGSKLSNVKKL